MLAEWELEIALAGAFGFVLALFAPVTLQHRAVEVVDHMVEEVLQALVASLELIG